MTPTSLQTHRTIAVMGHLRSDMSELFATDSWHDISMHTFPTGRIALRAKFYGATCLWFVPETLPDMIGVDFIQLISELRYADRFVLCAEHYDETSDRRASCLARTTFCVWPLAPPLLRELMETFLRNPRTDQAIAPALVEKHPSRNWPTP